MKLLKIIFSGEFIFALYLLVGSFKAAINIPLIDETLLLLIITIVIALNRFRLNKYEIPKYKIIPMILFISILVCATISLFYTPSVIYSIEKWVRFCIIAAWSYIGVFFLFKNEKSIRKFLWGIIFISLSMSLNLFLTGLNDDIGFQSTLGSSYIALGRISALGSLILLMFFLFSERKKWVKITFLILSLILLIPLIQSGARLPSILFIICLTIIILFLVKVTNKDILINKKVFPLLMVFTILISFLKLLISFGYGNTFLFRLNVLFNEEGGGESLSARTDRFEVAWEMMKSSWFMGKGLGSFPIYYSGIDMEDYPHNIFLEIISEIGILPLILFIIIIIISIGSGFKYYKIKGLDKESTSIYILFIFFILNSLGSSSMTGDKVLYAILAILIILPHIGTEIGIKNINKD